MNSRGSWVGFLSVGGFERGDGSLEVRPASVGVVADRKHGIVEVSGLRLVFDVERDAANLDCPGIGKLVQIHLAGPIEIYTDIHNAGWYASHLWFLSFRFGQAPCAATSMFFMNRLLRRKSRLLPLRTKTFS